MKSVKVIWSNGNYTCTEINGADRQIEEYYLNKYFNIGDGAGGDLVVKCIDIKFL
jgi:hypothetical protein